MIVSFLGTSFLTEALTASSSSSSSMAETSSPPEATTSPASAFVRRSKCGAVTDRSCSARCFLSSTANAVAPLTLPRSMGSLKCFTKVAWFPKIPGCAKSMRAQRSPRAFCTGVPLRSKRHLERTCLRFFPSNVEMFFILCASSHTTMSHGITPQPGRPCSGISGSKFSSTLSAASASASSSSPSSLRLFAPLPRPRRTGDGASSTVTSKSPSKFPSNW
mmetsp:Transcript_57639/g.153529  ORF Transcript_57639/g.153529 Transcript_57639/m.153529 type:complete len:219 (-) Transcript_57639:1112-1768(-)